MVRTSALHAGNVGSSPATATTTTKEYRKIWLCLLKVRKPGSQPGNGMAEFSRVTTLREQMWEAKRMCGWLPNKPVLYGRANDQSGNA